MCMLYHCLGSHAQFSLLAIFLLLLQVRSACHTINAGLHVITCGSYRRGRETCGDVDILVTHPDGHSHTGIFQQILELLTTQGKSCLLHAQCI